MKKRGQVTIFVILGLVVFVLVFIMFLYLFNVDDPSSDDVFTNEYPASLQPLANTVSYCVGILGEEAFKEIGLKGGITNTQNIKYNLEPAYLNSGIELFEGSDEIIPFWMYYGDDPSCVDCALIVNIPPLTGSSPNSISSQVELYIEDNILSCVNNFNEFPELTVSTGAPVASVIFREDDVFIGLDYPLEVLFPDGFEANLDKFSNTIDLSFKKTYDLATQVAIQTQFLDDEPFLDSSTKSILTLLSLGGKDALIPPMVPDVEFGSSFKFWVMRDVKSVISNTLQETIPYFQIIGSRDSFTPMTQNPYIDSIYSNFLFPLELDDTSALTNTKIRFNYFNSWPMYLDISPSRGELIAPIKDAGSSVKVPLIGEVSSTKYDYSYDLAYPLLVTFEDEESFNGEGYLFQFPLMVTIANNEPKNMQFDSMPQFSFDVDDFVESGFGSIEQRTVPVEISITNAYTGEVMYDLPLTYTCGSNSILLEPLSESSQSSVIKTKVPPCIGGMISVDDFRYFAQSITSNFLINEDVVVIDFLVYPEKLIEVSANPLHYIPTMQSTSIPTHPDFSRDWHVPHTESYLSPFDDEEIVLMFNRVQDVGDAAFFRAVTFNDPHSPQTVGLVPGKYEVTLVSSVDLKEPFIIKNMTYEVGDGWFSKLFVDETEIFLDELVFNESMVLGFVEFKNNNTLNLSGENLMASSYLDIVYPSFDYNDLLFHQDLDVFDEIQNATLKYPELFRIKMS